MLFSYQGFRLFFLAMYICLPIKTSIIKKNVSIEVVQRLDNIIFTLIDLLWIVNKPSLYIKAWMKNVDLFWNLVNLFSSIHITQRPIHSILKLSKFKYFTFVVFNFDSDFIFKGGIYFWTTLRFLHHRLVYFCSCLFI